MRMLKILTISFITILSFSIIAKTVWSGTIERVSTSTDGEQGDDGSFYGAAISADSRFFAFKSNERNLVPGDTNEKGDALVHDRQTGQTTRVNVTIDREQSNLDVDESSAFHALSADGRFVVFFTDADDIIQGDTNGVIDVFVNEWNNSDGSKDTLISADFNSGVQGFSYRDDEFRNTNLPAYAKGDRTLTGGYGGTGGLHVCVGNVDYKAVLNGMSGGWSKDFYLDQDADLDFSLRYRLMTSRYDPDECAEALVGIDGELAMQLALFCGRGKDGKHDTEWQMKTFNQVLSKGKHTLTVGAYNNKKTSKLEKTDAYFDDISVSLYEAFPPESDCGNGIDDDGDGDTDCDDSDCDDSGLCEGEPILSFNFNKGEHGFVYRNDVHYTNRPRYAYGELTESDGFKGSGGLHVGVGNTDNNRITDGMSGGWSKDFYLDKESDLDFNLRYRLMTSRYDEDECGTAFVSIDGDVYVYNPLSRLCGRGKDGKHDTGWQIETFNQILPKGKHTLTVGAYNNKKTSISEKTDAYFDDVSISIHEGDISETNCNNWEDDDGDGWYDCYDSDCADYKLCSDEPFFSANFDGCNDWIIYQDDIFNNTNHPLYASGVCAKSGGITGSGGLHLVLGGVDGRDIVDGISGGWSIIFFMDSIRGGWGYDNYSDVEISLDYRLVMTQFDADECATVFVQFGPGDVEELESLCHRGKDTGWKTKTFTRRLLHDDQSIRIGGYLNKKTAQREVADIYFDNIEVRIIHSETQTEIEWPDDT